jgi:hypothetical protein
MAPILPQSLVCQESALHGLGHWQRDRDLQVSAITDAFLAAVTRAQTLLACALRYQII